MKTINRPNSEKKAFEIGLLLKMWLEKNNIKLKHRYLFSVVGQA